LSNSLKAEVASGSTLWEEKTLREFSFLLYWREVQQMYAGIYAEEIRFIFLRF
jgi:hypothetical protein